MKREIKHFGNGAINLRLVEERDLETTLSWRNRNEARVWFKSTNLITFEQHLAWFRGYQAKDDDFLFVIEVNGKLVGQASVYGIDWVSGHAEIGRFLVAPESSGNGYIGQACQELLRFCSQELDLRYVFLEVLEKNERAISVYERNKFVEEQRYNGLIRMGLILTTS